MHKQRGSSRGTQRRGDFARDDPALAHSGDDDAAGAAVKQFNCTVELVGHRAGNAVSEVSQRLSLNADNVFAGAVHGKRMLAGTAPRVSVFGGTAPTYPVAIFLCEHPLPMP